jgi:hypothetical protein
LEQLGQGVSIESLTPNAQNQLRLLLGLSERACDLIAQHRILESLAFEGMYGRFEDVDEAHFETLRWIYGDDLYTDEDEDSADDEVEEVDEDSAEDETYKEDQDSADDEAGDIGEDEYEDEEKTSARELLLNWMSSGAGIFHISGKLGSGKSTLMKYLSDHNRTDELLGQWAGNYLRFSYSLCHGLMIIIRRTSTSLCSFLLLGAGVKDAEITCRPHQVSTARCFESMSSSHTGSSSRLLGSSQVDALAGAI